MVLSQTAVFLVRPTLTYRAVDLGADEGYIGFLVTVYAFMPALLAVPIGNLSDRRRPTPIYAAGIGALAVGAAALAIAPNLSTLTIATVILGLGAMVVMVGSQAVVARLSSPRSIDRDFGLLSAGASVGQMLGPLLSGFMLEGGVGERERTMLVFAAGAALAGAALIFAFGFPDRRLSRAEKTPPTWRDTAGILRVPAVRSAMIASITLLTTVDLLVAYLPLIGERTGIGPTVVGILLSIRAASSVLSRLLLAPLVRRFGRPALIVASTAMTAALVPFVAFIGPPWLLGIILVVLGFFLGVGQPLTMTVVSQSVPTHARGAALAVRMLGNKTGQTVLPALIASLTLAIGLGGAFAALGAILVVASLGSWHTSRQVGDSPEAPAIE